MTGAEINRRIDGLFQAFEARSGKRLVRDGVIDPEVWDRMPHKVLFILKERNLNAVQMKKLPADEPYDFRLSCRRGHWRVLGQWAYGLQAASGSWPEFGVADEHHKEAFHGTAIINLKKTPGGESSDGRQILEGAREFAPLLLEQLKLIQPDVVICGGRGETLQIAQEALGKDACRGWLDFYHPSCRRSHAFLYEKLRDICGTHNLIGERG